MDAEPKELDPREIKVLADILALVLEDQPGSSAAALDAIRRKARQSRVTGGALKNVFQSIATQPPGETRARTSFRGVPDTPEAMQASIERLRATNRTLEKALAAANGESARLQADLSHVQTKLVEVQQINRGFAERWSSERRRAGLAGAAIAACVLIVSGVIVERLFLHPAATARIAHQAWLSAPMAQPPESAPAARTERPAEHAAPAVAGGSAPGEAAEGDAELQLALKRLSHSPSGEAGVSAPAANGYLPPEVYSGIITHIRTCWRSYVTRLGDTHFQARLRVVADENGVIREARLVDENVAQLNDQAFQTFVQAAMHSVLDRDCAQLPIPASKLGHKITFDFVFVP